MAGSRTEKIGTIYSRVKGLLRTGAIKEVDKPIWYDVYEKFPPKDEPEYERIQKEQKVRDILYREDIIRARFYKTFGSMDTIDMTDYGSKPLSQRFIEMYNQEEKICPDSDDLFSIVVKKMKSDGYQMRTLEEIEKEKKIRLLMAKKEDAAKNKSGADSEMRNASAEDVFGKDVARPALDEPDSDVEDDFQPSR